MWANCGSSSMTSTRRTWSRGIERSSAKRGAGTTGAGAGGASGGGDSTAGACEDEDEDVDTERSVPTGVAGAGEVCGARGGSCSVKVLP
ncbi:hypothetical protein D3C72_1934200 [compost metagenome]